MSLWERRCDAALAHWWEAWWIGRAWQEPVATMVGNEDSARFRSIGHEEGRRRRTRRSRRRPTGDQQHALIQNPAVRETTDACDSTPGTGAPERQRGQSTDMGSTTGPEGG